MNASLVLCYHAVSATWKAPLSVRPEEFERQLTWFIRNGWQTTTFHRLITQPARGKRLAVTFDDGFLSVLTLGLPLLESLGIPGTVFAPTAFMDQRQALYWPGVYHWAATEHAAELQSMDWNDLGVLVEAGWEIGSHTRTHPHLTTVSRQTAVEELAQSREEIESALSVPCRTVAYPYGDVDAQTAAIASDVGFEAGAGLSRNLRGYGNMRCARLGVYNADHWNRFLLRSNPITRGLRRSALWPSS